MKNTDEPVRNGVSYRAMMDNIQTGIALIGRDFRIITANATQRAFFRKSLKDLVGRRCYAAFEKRRQVCPHCPGRRVMATKQPREAFTEGVRDDGTRFPVHIRAYPMLAADGSVTGFIELVDDLTGRKQAEEHLGFRNALLRTQQENSPDGILVVDGRGRMVSFNSRFVEMWGIPRRVVESRSDDLALKSVLDKLVDPEGFLARVRRLYRHRRERSREEIALKDGRTFDRHSAPMHGADGTYYGRVWFFRDVTKRKRAEKALAESERRFRLLFGTSNDAAFVHGVDSRGKLTRFVEVNDAACSRLGYARAELLKLTPMDIDAGGMEEARRQAVAALRRAGHAVFEMVHVAKDGRNIPVEISSRAFELDGRTHVLSVARDITLRKRAETALRESEEKFRVLANSAQDAIMAMDDGGRIAYWNPAAQRIFRLTRDEALGKPLHAALAAPRHLAAYRKAFQRWRRTGTGAAVGRTLEFTARRKDKTEFPIELSMSSLRVGGRWMAVGIARDITQRRKAEAELRRSRQLYKTLAEGIPDYVYLLEPDGRVLYSNRRMAGMPEVAGKRLTEIFPRASALKHLKVIRRVVRTGIPSRREVTLPGWHGPTVLENRLFPIKDRGGKVAMLVGLSRDITRAKRAEEERRALHGRVVTSQETERKRLARELHDGVGQILSGIKFSLQSLPKEIASSPRDAGRHVMKAAGHLDRAIAEIRRVSQNLMPSELEDLGLQPALRTLCRGLKARSGVAVTIRFTGVPRSVDPGLALALFRIAQEALNNVERHARARSVDLSLLRRKGGIELCVKDDGKGCAAQPSAGPQRPLGSLRGRGRKGEGHGGLGLTNISERVEALGGTIEFDSKPGKGTRLLVRAPMGNGGNGRP
ncbi:MAG: PAS domain S-box protein [Elusimicrobia bacterium]|nr:PAS domain S-box protein [Elusimicrobiota bacterium]